MSPLDEGEHLIETLGPTKALAVAKEKLAEVHDDMAMAVYCYVRGCCAGFNQGWDECMEAYDVWT